jgi:uncharacterized protein with PQ loop repeat
MFLWEWVLRSLFYFAHFVRVWLAYSCRSLRSRVARILLSLTSFACGSRRSPKCPTILYIMLHIPYIVSVLAPTVNSVQLFPQLHKTYTTRSVKDLSVWSFSLLVLTNFLWLLHGYFNLDYSIIAAGMISMTINSTLLTLILLYGK